MNELIVAAEWSLDRFPQLRHAPEWQDVFNRSLEVAEFCTENAAAIDRNGVFPKAEFERLRDANLLAIPLPRQWGGLGIGIQSETIANLLTILKQIGYGNLAVGRIYEGHINALQLIQTFGTEAQINRYSEDVAVHHKVFGIWNAEAKDGVKIVPLGSDRYRLEGAKTFTSGYGCVERPFVNGALPDGSWQMCIVPLDQVTVKVDPDWWQPSGMRASASYKVDFTGVEVTAADLIGQPGDYFRQPWLTSGVARFAAVQLGGAEALFDTTCQYLRELNYTNHPYQEERVARMAIALESGNLWLQGIANRLIAYSPLFAGKAQDTPQPQATTLVTYANMVRTAIEQICIDVMQLSERCIGTRGLLPPYPMERIIRDLTLYLRQPVFDIALASAGQYALATEKPVRSLWTIE
ncbi:MAG: acyl-CoA dehydrogenase [Alkalinema sp. CACIAM 70d]|nr:MAG: acyl-CoA dehydrogenase [Alkalinema sp. CACIAM 70d]